MDNSAATKWARNRRYEHPAAREDHHVNAGDEATHDAMARVPGAFRQTAGGMLQLAERHWPFTVRLRRSERSTPSVERARQLAIQAGAVRFEVVG